MVVLVVVHNFVVFVVDDSQETRRCMILYLILVSNQDCKLSFTFLFLCLSNITETLFNQLFMLFHLYKYMHNSIGLYVIRSSTRFFFFLSRTNKFFLFDFLFVFVLLLFVLFFYLYSYKLCLYFNI